MRTFTESKADGEGKKSIEIRDPELRTKICNNKVKGRCENIFDQIHCFPQVFIEFALKRLFKENFSSITYEFSLKASEDFSKTDKRYHIKVSFDSGSPRVYVIKFYFYLGCWCPLFMLKRFVQHLKWQNNIRSTTRVSLLYVERITSFNNNRKSFGHVSLLYKA